MQWIVGSYTMGGVTSENIPVGPCSTTIVLFWKATLWTGNCGPDTWLKK